MPHLSYKMAKNGYFWLKIADIQFTIFNRRKGFGN